MTKPVTCSCCGAPLHGTKCEFCGVEYEQQSNNELEIARLELEKASIIQQIDNDRHMLMLTQMLNGNFKPFQL